MSLISCYRIRFKMPIDKVGDVLSLIEEATAPDAVAMGELAEGKLPQKGFESVELLYQEKPDEVTLLGIFAQHNVQPLDYKIDTLGNEDWVTASLRELPAVKAGRFLIHGSHVRPEIKPAEYTLEIEAGLAFGTGHHETTTGCLTALSYLSKFYHPKRIIDIGTGTGVLAMAAVQLWRKKNVIATDIDSIAVRVTKSNIGKNSLSSYIRAYTATGTTHPKIQNSAPYDLIIANILARPLIALAKDFSAIAQKNGYVILSGLLWRQVQIVSHAYKKQGFTLHKALQFGEWATLILQKNKNHAYKLPKDS